ncbi:MAG: DUF2213 domain-containing protein, partial [Candidatus Thorarchaeota archaeon]
MSKTILDLSDYNWAYDSVEIDPQNFAEDEKTITFKDVVIVREIVQAYADGMAYKPADELEDYYWTVENRWATAGNHPPIGIITRRDEIDGKTVNVRFVKNLIDHDNTKRPNIRGVLADLIVFKDKVAPDVIKDMKTGAKPSVSIGFFYKKDETPGTWNGSAYDYKQTNIMHDHLAFGIDVGRCPFPQCGIGADELLMQIAGDPFAEYEDFEDCVEKIMAENPDYTREEAEGTCGEIESRSKEKHKEGDVVTIIMDALHNGGLDDRLKQVVVDTLNEAIQSFSKDEGSPECPLKALDEEFTKSLHAQTREKFGLTDDQWNALTDMEKEEHVFQYLSEDGMEQSRE